MVKDDRCSATDKMSYIASVMLLCNILEHTCLRAEVQAFWSLLAICDTMKLMAAEVVAIRLGEKVRDGGGFASNLHKYH